MIAVVKQYFQRIANESIPYLGMAFLLGLAEAMMIFSDRLVGLGGWYWYGLNMGAVYALFFGLPLLLISGFCQASTRARLFWGFSGFLIAVAGARYYRIFHGNLVDWPVRIALLAILIGIIGGSFITRRKHRWLASIPLLLLSTYFLVIIGVMTPRPTIRMNQPTDRPNIIWLTADTMRSDHLSQYGSDKDVFEQFDRWKEDFVQFNQSYSTSSWTGPSVASMLTSLYPLQHGKSRGSVMNNNIVTLPQVLRRAGYSTHAISNQPLVSPGWGFGKGFDQFYATSTLFMETTLIDLLNEFWLEEEMVRWTSDLNWVYNRFKTTQQTPAGLWRSYQQLMADGVSNPSFLYLYFFDPHSPYNPDKRWYPDGSSDVAETPYFNEKESLKPEGEPDTAVMADIKRRYNGEINDVGDKIDRIFTDLKERGLYEDSLIIFTSDHGEKFYDHGGWLHGGPLYQSVTRVPLFIKFPDGTMAGQQVDRPVDNTNLMPTILHELGTSVQLDYEMRGEPLVVDGGINESLFPPIMQRLDWDEPSVFYSVMVQENRKVFYRNDRDERSLTMYQLVGPEGMNRQPIESIPPDIRNTLFSRTNEHRKFPFAPRNAGQSHKEQLEALGYIE